MNQKIPLVVVLSLLGVLTVVYVLLRTGQQPVVVVDTAEPLPVFGFVSLEGEREKSGIAQQQAVNLAVEEINEGGGVDGRPLLLLWMNSVCRAETTPEAIQEALAEKSGWFLMGDCDQEDAVKNRLPEGEILSRLFPDSQDEVQALAAYVQKELGVTKAAVLRDETTLSAELASVFASPFASEESSVIQEEVQKNNRIQLSAALKRIRAQKPQAVLVLAEDADTEIMFLKQLKAWKVNAALFVFHPHAFSALPDLQTYEGVATADTLVDMGETRMKGMYQRYLERFGTTPEPLDRVMTSYATVWSLADMKAGIEATIAPSIHIFKMQNQVVADLGPAPFIPE